MQVVSTNEIKRGDIYLADLRPVVGSEESGIWPVLMIQNDIGNRYSDTVIVAAITGKCKKHLPTHVQISQTSLYIASTVLLEQIRTIDKQRLQTYLGRLNTKEMQDVDQALLTSLALNEQIQYEHTAKAEEVPSMHAML